MGGELDSKKKLEQQKREIVKQMRKVDEITDLPQDLFDERQEMWRQNLQEIEQRRNDLLLQLSQKPAEITRQKLHCQKNWTGGKREMTMAKMCEELYTTSPCHGA